jgi:hypothetical protein
MRGLKRVNWVTAPFLVLTPLVAVIWEDSTSRCSESTPPRSSSSCCTSPRPPSASRQVTIVTGEGVRPRAAHAGRTAASGVACGAPGIPRSPQSLAHARAATSSRFHDGLVLPPRSARRRSSTIRYIFPMSGWSQPRRRSRLAGGVCLCPRDRQLYPRSHRQGCCGR